MPYYNPTVRDIAFCSAVEDIPNRTDLIRVYADNIEPECKAGDLNLAAERWLSVERPDLLRRLAGQVAWMEACDIDGALGILVDIVTVRRCERRFSELKIRAWRGRGHS